MVENSTCTVCIVRKTWYKTLWDKFYSNFKWRLGANRAAWSYASIWHSFRAKKITTVKLLLNIVSKLHFDPEGGTFSNFSVSYKPSYLTVSFGKVIKRLMIALWSADICIMVVLVTCYTAICQADTVLRNLLNFKLKVIYYWLVLKFWKICQFVQV